MKLILHKNEGFKTKIKCLLLQSFHSYGIIIIYKDFNLLKYDYIMRDKS